MNDTFFLWAFCLHVFVSWQWQISVDFLIDVLDESLSVNYAFYHLTWADSIELVFLIFSELSIFL